MNKSGIIEVKTLARKLIRVSFEEEVIIDSQLLNLSNYVITTSDAGANDVSVNQIRGYNTIYNTSDYTTSFINLEITESTLDALYEINISNISTLNNLVLVGLRAYFRGRNTKYDSIIKYFPRYMGSDFNGILPNLLLAVSGPDEEIGGGTDFESLPRGVSTASTFGTGTFGTATAGG